MKVIIACLNSKYIHASLAPWCLLSGVRAYSALPVEVKVMESTINSDINAFAEQIINEKPDIVSFSSYIWNIEKTLELCEILKEKIFDWHGDTLTSLSEILASVCESLDEPTPIVLKSHLQDLKRFNVTRFSARDFVEIVYFDKMIFDFTGLNQQFAQELFSVYLTQGFKGVSSKFKCTQYSLNNGIN